MCTITWRFYNDGYSLFFNRDESRRRPRALLPQRFLFEHTEAIMPIDPQGEGSWLAVNNFGLSFALLNFYQGRTPKGRLISRGQIVKHCAEQISVDSAVAVLEGLKLSKYAPFSLLIFEPRARSQGRVHVSAAEAVTMLRWDGKALQRTEQNSPLISSAINFTTVCDSRQQIHHQLLSRASDSREDADARHYALHASHQPSKSDVSICMHRDDACTVSFSHIRVDAEKIAYFYADGAPCEHQATLVASVTRR